jgi:hypothetical protein
MRTIISGSRGAKDGEQRLKHVLNRLSRDARGCKGCDECLQVFRIQFLKPAGTQPGKYVPNEMTLCGTHR